ncbi:MAG: small basic protein [Planctomycetota bacterium]
MSMHSSFASGSGMAKHRNVLSRAERLQRLRDIGKYEEGQPVTNLPKVRNIKLT